MTTSNTSSSTLSDGRPAFVPARLRLREEQIQPLVSTETSPFGNSLAAILEKAYEAAGETAPKSPTATRTVKRSLDKHAVKWDNPLFGSLEIDVGHLELAEVVSRGPNTSSQVYIFNKPTMVWLNLATGAAEGVRILHAKAGTVTEVIDGSVPTLKVPVKWNERGQPHTRERDMDNVDVVFLNKEGMFVQLQVSLVTRKQRFWVCIQEIYAGQVVRTNHLKAKQLAVTTHHMGSHAGLIVPLYGENAYPGADYLKSNPRMGGQVVEAAIEWGLSIPMGDAVVAKWQPEQIELAADIAAKGFVPAVVTWFNLVIGYGFAVLPNGQSCYVHFNEVVDAAGSRVAESGECPMLQAMKAVAVKYQDGPKPKATAIRVL